MNATQSGTSSPAAQSIEKSETVEEVLGGGATVERVWYGKLAASEKRSASFQVGEVCHMETQHILHVTQCAYTAVVL